jgi:N-acetylglucosaminyldiphosphoundecaprenol N-acetyl-beta-D-mannosaminyltransferase
MEAQRDPTLQDILNNSLLVLPDGMPTVWIGRRQGHASMERVFGPDFMWEFCRRSVSAGVRHFLYGGRPGVALRLRENMEKAFPGIQVVGTFTPPFGPLSPEEECELISQVQRLKPDVVWVGISTPKQERFMAEFVNKLDTTLLIGVGAAFDLHTGNMKDSPVWMKRAGLQWLHRLSQDPKRLWKRYLVNNTLFIYSVSIQALGLRKSPRN